MSMKKNFKSISLFIFLLFNWKSNSFEAILISDGSFSFSICLILLFSFDSNFVLRRHPLEYFDNYNLFSEFTNSISVVGSKVENL